MKFGEHSFNRKNIIYDPRVAPFAENAKRLSEQPRRLISLSPNRRVSALTSKAVLTSDPIQQQIVTSRFCDNPCDPQNSHQPNKPYPFQKIPSNVQKQKKFSKTVMIQQFREEMNSIRKRIFANQYEMDNDLQHLQKQYQHEIHQIESSFEELFELLNIRFGKCLERVKHKYESAKRSIFSYSINVEETLQSFDRFERDIDNNYNSILNELSLQKFNDIMYQYNNKITQAEIKINNIPDLRLNTDDQKRVMNDMTNMLINPTYRRPPHPSMLQSDIHNDSNFDNIHIQLTQSKTAKNFKK